VGRGRKSPPPAPPGFAEGREVRKKARKQESKKARKQESKKARKQESKKARKQESKNARRRFAGRRRNMAGPLRDPPYGWWGAFWGSLFAFFSSEKEGLAWGGHDNGAGGPAPLVLGVVGWG
jgi:hypothetical protein